MNKYYAVERSPAYLMHHGVKGMKWGVRRYQNEDGTRTPLGNKTRAALRAKMRSEGKSYSAKDTVFISGSSKTQNKESEYYLRQLPKSFKSQLNEIMRKHAKVVVGDAPGIDRQVQNYLNKKGYDRVEVYGPGTEVRYSANKKWKTHAIDDPDHEPGSTEWLAKKDRAMEKVSTKGLAMVLDEGAKATRKNVKRMQSHKKPVQVFELQRGGTLAHYGIKGMKWGVWNTDTSSRYLGGKKTIKSRKKSAIDQSTNRNLDKWGKDEKHNCLYIGGISGSGKSTLAMGLRSQENANHIGLDAYFEKDFNTADRNTLQDSEFNDFLLKRGIDYRKIAKDAVNRQNRDWSLVDRFAASIEPFSRQQFKKGKKVVVEGVALNDETLFVDRDKALKNKPFIYLNTSETVSRGRAKKRDSKR